MGAWSVNSFGNDDALDWLDELITGDDKLLMRTLRSVADLPESEYLEAPEAAHAIAAAEIVAALRGFPTTKEVPTTASAWISKSSAKVDQDLLSLALKSIDRIQNNSELRGLWDDTDHAQAWYAEIKDLKIRLGQS